MESEKELTALERSKEDFLPLLERATKIVGIAYALELHQYTIRGKEVVQEGSSDFREQWLLKWSLRRLTEALESLHKNKGDTIATKTISDERPWAFLVYLLSKISDLALLDILLERNFTRILSGASRHILSKTAVTSHESVEPTYDSAIERPHKKRRLSPLFEASDTNDIGRIKAGDSIETVQALLLRIANRFAALLRRQTLPSNNIRVVTPTWTTSTDEAAKFVGHVIGLANTISTPKSSSKDHESASSTVYEWLSLWHEHSSASSIPDKQAIHVQFNEACLNGCLQWLETTAMKGSRVSVRKAQGLVEREVALHALLPSRANFNARVATNWKAVRDVVSWKEIEPVYEDVCNTLGSALVIEKVADTELTSFQNPMYASQLLSIAARLIPQDDLRRRQWERPWLEALSLALCHLAYPQDMNRFQRNQQGMLEATNQVLPSDLQQEHDWPTALLRTISEQRLELSTPVSSYLIFSILTWQGRSPSTQVLSQLLQLDIDCFVPIPEFPNSEKCLEKLIDLIGEQDAMPTDDFTSTVQNIIVPLMRGYARTRTLSAFIELWLPRLEDSLRVRPSALCKPGMIDGTFLWDDESLFQSLESLCQTDAPQNFAKELSIDTTRDLESIHERTGPTTDIFAKLAILSSVLRVGRPDLISSTDVTEKILLLSNAVLSALKVKNDYQGQRWRLWSILRILSSFDTPSVERSSLATSIFERDPCLELDSLLTQNNVGGAFPRHRSGLMLECFHYFALVLSLNPSRHPNIKDKVIYVIDHSIRLFASITNAAASDEDLARLVGISWNGRSDTLLSTQELACGYLAVVIQNPDSLTPPQKAKLRELLRPVTYQSSRSTGLPDMPLRSLGGITQALLAAICDYDGLPLFCEYAEVFLARSDIKIPSILHKLSLDQVEKASAGKVAEKIYHQIISTRGHESEVDQLCLLARLVVAFPVSVGQPENFDSLTILVHAIQSKSRPEEHESVVWCISKILKAYQDRVKNVNTGGRMDAVKGTIRSWLKQSTGETTTDRMLINMAVSVCDSTDFIPVAPRDALREDVDRPAGTKSDLMSSTIEEGLFDFRTISSLLSRAKAIAQKDAARLKLEAMTLLDSNVQAVTQVQKSVAIAALGMCADKKMLQCDTQVVRTLSKAVSLEEMVHTTDFLNLVLMMDASNIVLHKIPSIVNQDTIDKLLGSIAQISYSSKLFGDSDLAKNPANLQVTSAAVYNRLVTLVGTLLAHYRRRLSGRTHLLLPVLQNLLKCLFYTPGRTYIHQNPATTKQKQAFRSSLPAWLCLGKGDPLPPSSAENFARLLSSICNPTTTSARSAHRGRKRNIDLQLDDEVGKARRIAAQYMQYFVMEYTRCALDGMIHPDTREKLIPGLYAVLDALNKDLMRSMNAAMNPSSRAIFKGLYDDWVKFGRWDQS